MLRHLLFILLHATNYYCAYYVGKITRINSKILNIHQFRHQSATSYANERRIFIIRNFFCIWKSGWQERLLNIEPLNQPVLGEIKHPQNSSRQKWKQ
ncbi:hypothetical protein T03_766 [Trichinella britovi]|uniref:Secreted protein n=2 Tax=Trichinella TaxID=6333 RepID=A0A0V1C931_TRIBR|nr:hypothetical protein T05_2730 [Trichinella murrelli]KRX82884.1 hypothetical protein T06_16664 [Trichinella sp. T6]KRY45834.1 hypothetical protein T03_766 [Trichinella britovi]